MKIIYVIFLVLPLTCYSFPSSEKPVAAPEDSELAAKEPSKISKRSGGGSGSPDFFSHLKSGILGGLGKASAQFSSGSSGASSGHKHGGYHGHGNSVDFDPWTLKKSVLNTIFQAVKAITGGVTAIKGQLIKGSGYALAASGNLVASSGDKVTDVGKAIVQSAQLVHPSAHEHGSYGHSGSGGHSGGGHPFAKFSSLSGASSSSSSGSSSGHHPSGSGEVHGETVETYEVPSGPASGGHHQYGPPPAVVAKPGFHGGYSGGPPSYGSAAAYEGPINYQHHNFQGHTGPIVADTGSSTQSQSHSHSHSQSQNDYYEYPLTKQETEKASHALEELLHLLPLKKKTTTNTITATTTATNSNDYHHQQHNAAIAAIISNSYEHDNSNTNHYDNHIDYQQQQLQHYTDNTNYHHSSGGSGSSGSSSSGLGPIETIAVAQALTTAYGLPKEFDPNNTGIGFAANPSSSVNHHTEEKPKSNVYNSHPYDVYHSMSDKYKTQQHKYLDKHNQEIEHFQTQLSQSYQSNSNNNYQNNQISQNSINYNHNNNNLHNNDVTNSLGPIIVALGTTNTYPYKRDTNYFHNDIHSKYNPERVKNYLRQLNPQLMSPILTSSLSDDSSISPLSPPPPPPPLRPTAFQETPKNYIHGPPIPFIQNVTSRNNEQFHRNHIPIINNSKFNKRPFVRYNMKGLNFQKSNLHLRTPSKIQKLSGNSNNGVNVLNNLNNYPTTSHGFDGQHFYTF